MGSWMKDEEDDWVWQEYVNNTFPGLIVGATIVLILMIVGAYIIL
jgi:hypothetical protein